MFEPVVVPWKTSQEEPKSLNLLNSCVPRIWIQIQVLWSRLRSRRFRRVSKTELPPHTSFWARLGKTHVNSKVVTDLNGCLQVIMTTKMVTISRKLLQSSQIQLMIISDYGTFLAVACSDSRCQQSRHQRNMQQEGFVFRETPFWRGFYKAAGWDSSAFVVFAILWYYIIWCMYNR